MNKTVTTLIIAASLSTMSSFSYAADGGRYGDPATYNDKDGLFGTSATIIDAKTDVNGADDQNMIALNVAGGARYGTAATYNDKEVCSVFLPNPELSKISMAIFCNALNPAMWL